MPETRLVHTCQESGIGEDDMFYVSATYDDVTEELDWYAWEDQRTGLGQAEEVEGIGAVMYCPWCGLKMPDTPADALVNPTFRQEPVEDYDEDEEEEPHV